MASQTTPTHEESTSTVIAAAHTALVQQLKTGALIVSADRRILEANPAAMALLGLTGAALRGRPHLTTAGIDTTVVTAIIAAVGDAAACDDRLQLTIPATGRIVSLSVTAIREESNDARGWMVALAPVPDNLQPESARESAEATFRAIIDTLQDAYFESDPFGRITYVNDAFVRVTGYEKKQDLIGRHFRHVVARKSLRPSYEHFKKLYETGTALPPFDFSYRTKDGSEYSSEILASPIIENGSVVGARGMVRDISVRAEAESILREARDAAEQRAGELAAINRVATTVTQSLDLQAILQSLCVEFTGIFPVRNAGIALLNEDETALEVVAFHAVDPTEESALGVILDLEGNQASRQVLTNRETLVVQDVQTDPRTKAIHDLSRARGSRSFILVPLLARGKAIGTIGMPAKDPNHVFTEAEIELAETVASQIATAVQNARLHAQTETALDVVEHDLEIGRQIQAGFFPETLPTIPGWEIATHFQAARQVAGDFYDAFSLRDSNLTAFVIADVCDKGVGAALFMVLFRSLLRAFSEGNINASNVQERLQQVIVSTNNFIAEYHGRSNMFATIFFGILDPERGMLYYVNGGHEAPIILDKAGAITARLMPTGPAVGLFPDMSFRVEQVKMRRGDCLIGFTDGVTDAKSSAGELFSEERLLQVVASPWTSIFSMVFELQSALRRHIGDRQQFDDITLISFRHKVTAVAERHAICRVARIENLGEMRSFVTAAAEHSGLVHEDVFAFKLAADELCTNIIQYGYEEGEPGLLSLFFDVEGNRARLTIRDDGVHFAPDAAPTPDVDLACEDRDSGGLGLFFVRELMDTVSYGSDAHGNVLVLEKKLGSKEKR